MTCWCHMPISARCFIYWDAVTTADRGQLLPVLRMAQSCLTVLNMPMRATSFVSIALGPVFDCDEKEPPHLLKATYGGVCLHMYHVLHDVVLLTDNCETVLDLSHDFDVGFTPMTVLKRADRACHAAVHVKGNACSLR